MEHVCEICGKVFATNSKVAKYCSHKCNVRAFLQRKGCTMQEYRKSIRKKKVHDTIRCPVCGKMFMPSRADIKYCSKACKFHRENVLARVRKNNELAKHMDAFGHIQVQCEVCKRWFTPKTKEDKICTSCQIFLKYTNAHPEFLQRA